MPQIYTHLTGFSEASLDMMKDLLVGIRYFIILFAPHPAIDIYSPLWGEWVSMAGRGAYMKRGREGVPYLFIFESGPKLEIFRRREGYAQIFFGSGSIFT